MANIISKIMDQLYKDKSVHGVNCLLKKSNDSYMSCIKINAIIIFCQKHGLKNCEDEVLKMFYEIAQSGILSIFK